MQMTVHDLYYLIIIISATISFSLIYDGFFSKNIIKQKIQMSRVYKEFLNSLSDKTKDDVFGKIGIRLSIKKYTAYRNLIATMLLLWSFYNAINGQPQTSIKTTLVLLVLLIVTVPKNEIIKGIKSPFKMCFDLAYKRRQTVIDKELINVISQMRNLIISNDKSLSADYILTRLVPHTNQSKEIFVQTHSFLQKGRKNDAAKYFKTAYNTWLGGEFSQVLLKLDTLPANEFLQQIEILQESIEDIKDTDASRKIETKKTLLFTYATLQIMLIIFDFIYIVMTDSIYSMTM
ncbi:MAG: hypothetical protein PHQ49_07295 [Clostridia bacterium]|nr:hypothetical protein [Clostridia bacterium]